MLDLNAIRHPKADKPRQAKFTLSETAHNKLRQASITSGQDMSAIVDMLIRHHLSVDGRTTAPRPAAEQPVNHRNDADEEDFDLDA